MEGVPRIPMMGFPMRRSADTPHFRSRLKSFISNHYNEEPDSYSNEIHELESLRASAVHVSKDYSGCSTLKKYFCQLNFLKSRFPMNEEGSCAVSFSWYDVFSEHVHGWSDVDFEMSCILYNIGALHSELGALDNRQTADGMKTSCTHFQCAAWAFSHLRHNYQKFFTPDVSPDMLNILYNICLAQAQECILEKSLIDNRKSTITAKVALQIVEYYSIALRIIDTMSKDATQYSDKLIKSVRTWRKLVELKVHYYGCIAYLYRGMQAEDQSKWGERVAMYKAAAEKLNTCIKHAKNLEKTDPVHDTLHFTLDVVGGKVAIAEKENEFIYHEKVPELEAVMSDVKGVSLVKGIQFKFDDPQVAGPDIFGRLVPMEAHEASSLYSEEKAKILRTYSRKIEEKNECLDKFVLPLQLEQLELHDSDKIPQELIDCCAALSVNQDAVKRLSELMANLSGLFHDVEANLEEIQDHLADQEKKEKEYQEVVGKRPPNNIINEINREFQKYQSAQAVAAESNKTLHEAMVAHVANLTILMKPLDDVMKQIPNYDELEKNEEALERMKKLAGKIGEMRKQREMLESQLRDSILNDDITKSLVVKKDENLEDVFKQELQKHDKVTQLLDQNLLAQENIIRALTEANAEYAETRRATVELKKKRDAVIQSYISSYEAYDELISKCNKGIEFYTKLNANVEKLLQRMRSVCKVQNEEREINMERIIRKAQAPRIPPVVPGVNPGSVAGYNNMMAGQYPGYPTPPTSSMSTAPPSMPGGYSVPPSMPATPPSSSIPHRPSTGGHLKLKDYLAMKKEGHNPASMLPSNMASQAPGAPPQSSVNMDCDPAPGVGGQQMQYTHHHPMMSSTPPPVNPNIGVRPAPVGSEDVGVGKDNNSAYNYNTYPQQQHQQQQQPSYNNYSYYTPQPASNPNTGAPPASYPNNASGSGYYNQQNYNSTPPPSNQAPTSSTGYYQMPPQQQPTPPPQAPTQNQNSTPSAPMPAAISSAPSIQQQQQPQQQQYVPQQHQQQYLPPQPQVPSSMMSSYIPNQAGYHLASMDTSSYANVYSSKPPSSVGNTFSQSYGIPLSYSGPSIYQQTSTTSAPGSAPAAHYPSPARPQPTPAIVPPSQPAPNPNNPTSPYYTPAYHRPPTANTITNATFSTGTIVTPTQMPSQQPTQPPPPTSSAAVQENPAVAPPPQLQQQPQQPTPQQQQPQQQPQSNIPSDIDSYNPANSFLAQYVRQNQGYISSSSAQPPTNSTSNSTFPSSVNYGSGVSGYSQQQPQQQTNFSQPASYPQQPQQTNSTTGFGQQQNNQYAGYNQQWPQQQQSTQTQQVPQPGQPPQQQQQQQPAGYQAPYQQQQQQNYQGQQQPYQQYGTPQQHQQQPQQQQQNYYNAPPAPQSQPSPQPPPPQPSKSVGGSNLDLLSDIDFNAASSMAPLAPQVVSSSENNQETQPSAPALSSSTTPTSASVSSLPVTLPSSLPTPTSSTSAKPSSSSPSVLPSPSSVSPVITPSLPVILNNISRSSSSSSISKSNSARDPNDPFQDPVVLEEFVNQVEFFEKTVEELTLKSSSEPAITNLDLKWKELIKFQNATIVQLSTSVARQYPTKNRFPDIMPFDQTRVPLPNMKDDYINASFVNELSSTAYPLIATQAPLHETMEDFWQMIWQHHVELVVCLCSDIDVYQDKYWPIEKGIVGTLEHGPLKIVLQTRNNTANYIVRTVTVSHRDLNQTRVVVHLQFTGWTGHTFPVSPGPLVDFVKKVSSFYHQQRKLTHPVVVHCVPGVGKTGVFCVLAAAMEEIIKRHDIPDVTQIAGKASEQRKNIMNDKEYLRFTYSCLLHYCQEILIKHGKRTAKPAVQETAKVSHHTRRSSKDFLEEISLSNLLSGHKMPSSSNSSSPLRSSPLHHSTKITSPRIQRGLSLAETSKTKLSYSDVPESLTNIDPITFRLKDEDENISNSKRLAFENSKGTLFAEKSNDSTQDPFSSIDPLWTLKK